MAEEISKKKVVYSIRGMGGVQVQRHGIFGFLGSIDRGVGHCCGNMPREPLRTDRERARNSSSRRPFAARYRSETR
jgi:hypothetical protein